MATDYENEYLNRIFKEYDLESEPPFYWDNLSNQNKYIALSYVYILKTKQQNELNNFLEVPRFQNSGIDIFKIPDWVWRSRPEVIKEMRNDYIHPQTKKMLNELKDAGKL
jgi:hypothetical protein